MRSKLLFLILVLVTLAALPCSVSANLVPNPGFENGIYIVTNYPEDWGGWNPGAGVNSWVSGGAHTGNYSVGLLGDGTGVGAMMWPIGTTTATSDIPVTEGTNYYLSVWARGAGGSFDGKIDWLINDADDFESLGLGSTITFTGQSTTATWAKYSVGPLLPFAGAGYGRVVLNCVNAPEVFFDDIYFDSVPVAGASGVHSPDPANGTTVEPGLDLLKWMRYKGQQGDSLLATFQICEDCNDTNFDVLQETLYTDQDVNSCSLSGDGPPSFGTVTAEHNYAWRVVCEDPNGDNWGTVSLVGPVWMFTTVNTAPDVDAGLKQAKWQDSTGNPVTFQLAPTVNDDGLPIPPGAVTYLWTKTGATSTGTVTFTPGGATSTALAPTVTMSDPCAVGDYELTLTVDDGSALTGSDTVKIRVHANDTTGLEARYDCEEGNPAAGIHDDYSGYDRNPTGAPGPKGPPTRRGERMNNIDQPGIIATTMDGSGGHNAQPWQNAGDLTLGGMITNGNTGHVELSNSHADPNHEDPIWADFTDEVTLAAWIKVDSENGGFDDNWEAIIVKGYPGAYRLERNAGTDGVQFTVDYDLSDDGIANVDGSYAAYGGMNVNDGEWHHVVGTYDGAYVCVYVDGIIDDCVETDGDRISLNALPVTLGINTGTATMQAFGGIYDEIRIHSIGLPYTSDAAEDNSDMVNNPPEITARSILSIYRSSNGHVSCADENGGYMVGDVNEDCYIDMGDVRQMAREWLECNDISAGGCDEYSFVYTP